MGRDLPGLAGLLNRNPLARQHNAHASRRHAKILGTDPDALLALNYGHHQAPELAPDVTSIEAEIEIALLDRILERERRGPRAAETFDTRLLLKRSRRGPRHSTK